MVENSERGFLGKLKVILSLKFGSEKKIIKQKFIDFPSFFVQYQGYTDRFIKQITAV